MSILHSRIVAHGGSGRDVAAARDMHPWGTGATVVTLPSAMLVEYAPYVGTYQDIYPSPAAYADPNAAPATSPDPAVRSQPPAGDPGYDTRRRWVVAPAGYTSADPNAAPVAMISSGSWAPVIPAGRP